ncbi:hypothetical protein [Leuconostoc miyukkimchii]|uniref:hypothetical protein n=1 Tax=Leuconostoc miyukkimchii TaxID=910540 RepID=UPI001C7CB881|nr:hypothetical protein [Leuconostoc miyukkimchii]
MNEKLNPSELRSFIDKDMRFQRAEALLTNHWETLLLSEHWGMNMITLADITFAKVLLHHQLVASDIDFTSFAGINKFIIDNQSRLSVDVVKKLKEPFL